MSSTNAPGRRRGERPLLRVQIFRGLVLIATLPVVVFTALSGYSHTLEHRSETSSRLRGTATAIAGDVGTYLTEHRRAIVALSEALRLDADLTTPRLNRWLAEYHAIYDGFITMLATDREGRLIASHPVRTLDDSALVLDVLPSVADREYFRRPMATGEPFISDAFLGRGFGSDPIVAISAPVLDQDGRRAALVEGSLHLGRLARFVERYLGAEGLEVVIADHLDRVLYATPGVAVEVLEPLAGSALLTAVRAAAPGEAPYESEDGRAFMAAYAVTWHGGWQIFVPQSLEAVRRELRRYYLVSMLWAVSAAALSIFLARGLAGNVVRPLEQLVERVHGLAIDGAPPAAGPEISRSAPREVAQLMRNVDEMAIGLHESYEQLREAVAARDSLNRELDRKVHRRTAELADKNAELERFAYSVSHDLKSPLVTLAGFLDLLAKDFAAGDADRVRRDLATLNDTVDRMKRLVDGLLELSRIGREGVERRQVETGALAREAVELLAGRLGEAGVGVEVAPDLPRAWADPVLLRIVFQNLLENAVKFTARQRQPRIRVAARDDGGETVYCVEDNGAGVDPRHHKKIFEVFAKLDAAGSGTGIGLATVQRVVNLHGGRIWVESEGEGRGSVFCFTLSPGEDWK